jgi:dTDP-4-amino-4,6-dideoxygalactose transaminase
MYRLLSKRGLAVGTFRFGEAEGRLNPEYSRKMAPSLQRRLRAKQPRAAREVEHRRRIARLYSDGLDAMGLRCISSPAGADAVFMRYPVLARDKEHVLRAARQRRIELGDWYTSPIHPLEETQWAAVGYRKGMCPAAEEASRRIVTLPIYAGVTESTASNCLSFLDEMRSAGAV